jgi:succinate dehydrogenase/fumarate reductase flavoprotein subunit
LPNNRHEVEAGFVDSVADVLTYLMSLSHGLIERPMIEAFARTAPEVVDWLEQHTPVQFETVAGLSDYHPEHPGGRREGRSVECPLFPFEELGAWAPRVTVGWQLTGEFCMSETALGRKAPNGLPGEELERRKIHDERGAGQALVGRLLSACLDRGVEPRTNCRGIRLLDDDGSVIGVAIEGADGPFEVRGVVAWCSRPAVSSMTRSSCGRSCVGRSTEPSVCRPTPATVCAWRCELVQTSPTCVRRGGWRPSMWRWPVAGLSRGR